MERKKRVRRANYTAEERTLLAELVTKYKHIIEDKRIGGIYIRKKKEAWGVIKNKYNSNCTTGAREVEHLKALYDNMKQKSRKTVAENNVQMNKTGEGVWKPKSTDCDSKTLAVIEVQVEPLPNPYDSAAAYFKETDPLHELLPYTPESDENNISDSTHIGLTPAESTVVQNDQDQGVPKTISNKVITPSRCKFVKKKLVPKKIIKDNSVEALKRLYFKKKIQNAQMERRKLALEILFMKEEHKLKMEILKKKML
ncbi:uncharacterized protein LOC124640053 isoform X2 [Helicoverpa zea]|uniref:uncharacterized protein LOC124640053 isoform X2 n=1 Tax=Helicoverpa zea TaxID=7113 RepID=UPI001F59B843|nr:uncharacterized protein LOC124640053 isoform X2 [Helicoverpa zea]